MALTSGDVKASLSVGHEHNLTDFLIIYGRLSSKEAVNPKLEDVTLKGIKISYGPNSARKVAKIKFNREQKDYEQTKSLLISMTMEASSKRGYSSYLIKEIPLPSKPIEILYWVLFFAITYASFTPAETAAFFVNYLHVSVPAATKTVSAFKWILNFLFVTHSTETATSLNPILFKYRVPIPKRMLASVLCLVEGKFFIKRFQRLCDSVEHQQ